MSRIVVCAVALAALLLVQGVRPIHPISSLPYVITKLCTPRSRCLLDDVHVPIPNTIPSFPILSMNEAPTAAVVVEEKEKCIVVGTPVDSDSDGIDDQYVMTHCA